MWSFKKKIQTIQNIPMDCIFNSVMEDLKISENWEFCYKDAYRESFKHKTKNYSIKCYSVDRTAWIDGIDYKNCFTSHQQRILYKKCKELWRKQEMEMLKSIFPECFTSTLDQ